MKPAIFLSCLVLGSVAWAQPLTLDQALAAARSNRPTLDAARLRLAQARHLRRAAGSIPSTRLSVGYGTRPEAGGSDDDLVVSQALDVFGRTNAAKGAADARIAVAEAEFRQAAGEVQAQVVEAFAEAAGAAERARTGLAQVETLQRLYAATQLRVNGGLIPGIQLSRVGLELDQAKLGAERRQAEHRANLERLAAAIGRYGSPVEVGGFPMLSTPAATESELAAQRPDLLLLAGEVRSAEADAKVARLEGVPELEVQGRRTPWQDSPSNYGLRIQLSWPIFDHGRIRAEVRAANARTESAHKALDDARRLAVGEVSAAKIEVDAADSQVERYEGLVATASELVRRLTPALTEQATTVFEVIDATRTLRDVEESLAEAKERRTLARARYLRATGHLIEVGS